MDLIRAWKDPEYRSQLHLSGTSVDAHPAGVVEFSEAELGVLAGGEAGGPQSYNPTSDYGCYSVGETFCNGTCALFGTMGCCPN